MQLPNRGLEPEQFLSQHIGVGQIGVGQHFVDEAGKRHEGCVGGCLAQQHGEVVADGREVAIRPEQRRDAVGSRRLGRRAARIRLGEVDTQQFRQALVMANGGELILAFVDHALTQHRSSSRRDGEEAGVRPARRCPPGTAKRVRTVPPGDDVVATVASSPRRGDAHASLSTAGIIAMPPGAP